ncbi:MAG: DMT family transporter [Acidiferrobacterales bacterium]
MSAHRGLPPGVINALVAAVLFGASVPLAKELLRGIAPVLLAGLLYIGSGAGLYGIYILRRLMLGRKTPREPGVTCSDLPWFAAAIGLGGILAPALLMTGLRITGAATTSLLLNLEGAFTAVLAWFAFRENFDRRIVLGMLAIVIAGVLLVWPVAGLAHNDALGSLAIVGACLAWAVDNNLTRKVSAGNPLQIAGAKGLVAGAVNTGIGLIMGGVLPDHIHLAGAALVGAAGYGLSLALYVLALRRIGAARTAAYFSLAPFIGAATSIAFLHENPAALFWPASGLMAIGIWLHILEHHEHLHHHDVLTHSHSHTHDDHHRHQHDFAWNGKEPHTHRHAHEPLWHSHPHYPDIHHRHPH